MNNNEAEITRILRDAFPRHEFRVTWKEKSCAVQFGNDGSRGTIIEIEVDNTGSVEKIAQSLKSMLQPAIQAMQ